MHFDKVDAAITAGDAKLLVDREGRRCVRAATDAFFPTTTSPTTSRSNQRRSQAIRVSTCPRRLARSADGRDGQRERVGGTLDDAGMPRWTPLASSSDAEPLR